MPNKPTGLHTTVPSLSPKRLRPFRMTEDLPHPKVPTTARAISNLGLSPLNFSAASSVVEREKKKSTTHIRYISIYDYVSAIAVDLHSQAAAPWASRERANN